MDLIDEKTDQGQKCFVCQIEIERLSDPPIYLVDEDDEGTPVLCFTCALDVEKQLNDIRANQRIKHRLTQPDREYIWITFIILGVLLVLGIFSVGCKTVWNTWFG